MKQRTVKGDLDLLHAEARCLRRKIEKMALFGLLKRVNNKADEVWENIKQLFKNNA